MYLVSTLVANLLPREAELQLDQGRVAKGTYEQHSMLGIKGQERSSGWLLSRFDHYHMHLHEKSAQVDKRNETIFWLGHACSSSSNGA